jgi:hypothetical protein
MPIPVTAWRNFVDANTALINGEPWPWQYGSDDMVPMDLSAALDDGESVVNPVATLRKLPAFGESDFTAATDKITGTTVSGSAVLVQMTALEQGRFYKLDVLIGAAGNRRGGNTIIQVSG